MGSILLQIKAQRILDVEQAKAITSQHELEQSISNAPTIVDFAKRLRDGMPAAVIGEIKRASPSKGDIFPNANATEVAERYARAGAAGVSVLTEPKWFKGSLEDLRQVRLALEDIHPRPAILRKDFIIDEYQVYEARVYGADTLLLIVAILSNDELKSLIALSRQLGMEPLVEVANEDEMKRALECGTLVVGINNRNLHDFSVDLSTTERVVASAGQTEMLMVALSGISNRVDVQRYRCANVDAFLVGEALMRSSNPSRILQSLRGETGGGIPLVKICGLRDVPTALHTIRAGADFVGLVFAESRRKVDVTKAREISDAIHAAMPGGRKCLGYLRSREASISSSQQFLTSAQLRKVCSHGPLVVGVFADQSVDDVIAIARAADLDIVQLSGKEDAKLYVLPRDDSDKPAAATTQADAQTSEKGYFWPIFKAVHVGEDHSQENVLEAVRSVQPHTGLLDTKDTNMLGGTGRTFDWTVAQHVCRQTDVFLAGGLNPLNAREAVEKVRPFGLDVSSGVETEGTKDLTKISEFVMQAKMVEDGLIK
eukprot:c6964_g1_i2.p1 GENE.c6964_g1_i2~~c6964_g1_i2.p1  ORF type:complete len:542 (-),score=117.00 c6964_g1_i2:39-1664(-)